MNSLMYLFIKKCLFRIYKVLVTIPEALREIYERVKYIREFGENKHNNKEMKI